MTDNEAGVLDFAEWAARDHFQNIALRTEAMSPDLAAAVLRRLSEEEGFKPQKIATHVEALREGTRVQLGKSASQALKHLPLSIHPKAPAAHAAAEAAHRQGRFWEMHDRIFSAQRDMSPENYREYATDMGLDLAQYDRDVSSGSVKSRIDADVREAAKLGVTGTPSFFVNGRFLSGAQPFESFKRIIDEELKEG